MKLRSALTIASILLLGILFIIGATFNGRSVATTKVAASQVTFQGGATDEMLAFALNFGEASNLAVFGGRNLSNHGQSVFRGDVGSAGRTTGIESLSVRSYNFGQAKQDMKRALNIIRQLPCAEVTDTQLAGKTFTPGVYCLGSAELAGALTVNGGNDPNSRFIFRVAGTFKTDAGSSVELAGGARATNVYVVADDSITVGGDSDINANLISAKGVTLNTGSTVGGKTMSSEGDVETNSVVAGAGTGSVEICKQLSPGDPIAPGTIFTFTVPGFADPIQVPAGACSSPLDVAIGNQTITETARANTAVVNITVNPSNRMVSRNLGTRSVVVAVPEGGISDQTVVTFTNQTTRTGILEICKQGLDSDVTGFFQYNVQGVPGQTFAVPVGFCSGPITTTILQTPDTPFTAIVTELARANFRAESASTLPSNRLVAFAQNVGFDQNFNPISNTNGAAAQILLISGGTVSQQTVVTFANRSLPGRLKVCKITADPANIPVGTIFRFTVDGTAPTSPTQTTPGTAVRVIVDVPAGPDSQGGFCQFVDGTFVVDTQLVIQETGLAPGQTLPGGLTFADTRVSRIRSSTGVFGLNLDQRAIGTFQRNTTTEVDFTNFVFRPAVLKICKNAGTGVTPGTVFNFVLSAANPLVTRPISSTPIPVPAGSCVFAQGPFPSVENFPGIGTFNLNTGVVVTEAAAAGFSVTAVNSPTGGPLSGVSLPNRTATITLNQALLPNSLVNEIAFTNSAAVPPPPPPLRAKLDFDGDGKSDVALFRPSTGDWWYSASGAGNAQRPYHWGVAGDRMVAADYDGDGITDYAVYRNGDWYVMGSTGQYMAGSWGLATDIPVAGDFDGDGRADFAVYRPSNGSWWIRSNNAAQTTAVVQFGISTDIPVAADYDGDGKMDPAVYRSGTWYILGSSAGFSAVQWGISTDRPIPADYDGDRKADLAIYRNGEWWILKSGGGVIATTWGLSGDVPVPADYNGDGMTDIVVYRPSNNRWLFNYSGAPLLAPEIQFGSPGDINVNY